MECHLDANKKGCNCTYPCDKHGKCCECIAYHRRSHELPACYFSKAEEATYDRSIAYYTQCHRGK